MQFTAFLLGLLSLLVLSSSQAEEKTIDLTSPPTQSSGEQDKVSDAPPPSEPCTLDSCKGGLGKVVTVPGGD